MPYWLTERKWIALWAAFFGYMLDAMDVLLFVLTIIVNLAARSIVEWNDRRMKGA